MAFFKSYSFLRCQTFDVQHKVWSS